MKVNVAAGKESAAGMLLVARLGDFEVVRGRNLDAGKNPVDAVGLLLVTICFFCQPMRNVLTLDEFVMVRVCVCVPRIAYGFK